MQQEEGVRPMPMKSRIQRKYLWANHPEIAKKFEAKTSKKKNLPKKVQHGKK